MRNIWITILVLMNMLNKMDKNQLSNGLNQLNQILSPEEKNKIIQALNSNKKN